MRKWLAAAIGLLLLIIAGNIGLTYLLGFKLHHALGFLAVYRKNVLIHLAAVYGGAAAVSLLSLASVRPFRPALGRYAGAGIQLAAAVLGWMVGFSLGQIDPAKWLLFFRHVPFGSADPIYHLDESFYVYSLPILESLIAKLSTLLFFLFVIQLALLLTLHAFRDLSKAKAIVHAARTAARMASGYVLLLAAARCLSLFSMLYTSGEGNFLFGPGFTATHWTLPIAIPLETLLLLVLSGYLLTLSFRLQRLELITRVNTYRRLFGIAGGLLGSFILLPLIGTLINAVYVHPNQETVETPYISRTIEATRWALDIQHVQTRSFKPDNNLNSRTIGQYHNLLANIRINDIGQTRDIFNQLQSFKSYFEFQSAEPDRYDGQEVYIDTRQMNVSKLPVKTWINQNLVYTHGYGVAASPVNEFTSDGLPVTIAQDTPQRTSPPIPAIRQPEIYFGTMDNNVIAPSREAEFDYPVGSDSHTSHYKGGYALPLKGNRWLLALEEANLKYLTSGQLTGRSQLLFDRNIYTRVQDIAPFLQYGQDAYPFVTKNGQIEWMMDGYTSTDRIPYAQTFSGVNYERNSVKIVMNAYTGQVTYYVTDPADPLIRSLMAVYPGLFTTDIPSDVRAHFRYPKELFQLQTAAIQTYHMTDPSAFYNQEDLWEQAQEIYNQNQSSVRPPVYQMIQLPGTDRPSFVLSQLFTPSNKQNLNGWLVAGNDGADYGRLTLYQFPQEELVFGPMQAENQIDSSPNISQQLTLWNQQGSHVVRGNLLMVPLGQAVLYVEPIYLVADRSGSLPQLQRVILDYNKNVYMGTTLSDALNNMLQGIAIGQAGGAGTGNAGNAAGGASGNAGQPGNAGNAGTGGTGTGSPAGGGSGPAGGSADTGGLSPAPSGSLPDLARQAAQLLDDYKKQNAAGNFDAAGADLKKIAAILKRMSGQ